MGPAGLPRLHRDGDGYGDPDTSIAACEAPEDFVEDGTDCDDTTASKNPGNLHDFCDGVDNDCDDLVDEDSKADWEQLTLAGDTAYIVDPATAELTAIGTVPYIVDFNSADSRERGETLALGFNGTSLHQYDICDSAQEVVGETRVTGGCGSASVQTARSMGFCRARTSSSATTP